MTEQDQGHGPTPSAMGVVRSRLIAKIDEMISQIAISETTPSNSHLQIEANLMSPYATTAASRRFILDTINVDELRHHITDNDSSVWPAPQKPGFHHGLSSPMDSYHASTPPSARNHALTVGDSAPYLATILSRPSAPNGDFFATEIHRPVQGSQDVPPLTMLSDPSALPIEALEGISRNSSKRRRSSTSNVPKLEQSAIDKLLEGIWEQIHNPKSLATGNDLKETMSSVLEKLSGDANHLNGADLDFGKATNYCRQITTSTRTARAFEVIVQAHWVDCYDARLAKLREEHPSLRAQECKRMVTNEACASFAWSDKELRNRMAIWRGYQEIKNAAGWSALIFAGAGIYRFCKYRLCFDQEAIEKLQNIRTRAELAADTLQPQWRSLLSLVGESTQLQWHGHPHDWTVGMKKDKNPKPLAETYHQWDPNFSFRNLEDSTIDTEKWDRTDPRRCDNGPIFTCRSCSQRQSTVSEENECHCLPDLYSPNARKPCPVQIFQTDNGKNNGLIACCSFEAGQAVGEFVGMITKGLADVDVMQSQAGDNEPYQIWQGKYGNYTRFINHSCVPNCEFQTFSWLGIQRIVVVSRGVPAGKELTVDYSSRYWHNLDKVCLCGEPACKYNGQARNRLIDN